MSNTKVKRGPGRPKGSKNKVKSISTVVKRGRGRPKGSKNKITANNVSSVKRGRGRPKGSKNKVEIDEEFYNLPFEKPSTEEERVANIAHMVSFYQHPDGRSKGIVNAPKKRGRKPKLDLMDDDALVKGDLDKDHFVYTDKDINEELARTDAYQDFMVNRSRYSDSF